MTSQVEASATLAPPSDDELGRAVLAGAGLAVSKHFIGAYPPGMDRDGVVSLITEVALARCRKWRAGGPKSLKDYCYMACKFALLSWARSRRDRARNPHAKVDVLDLVNTMPLQDAPCLVAKEDSGEGD